ncbi:MAG: hypothetical protein ACI9C4_001317, partial [Paraglaciecola sp.]
PPEKAICSHIGGSIKLVLIGRFGTKPVIVL